MPRADSSLSLEWVLPDRQADRFDSSSVTPFNPDSPKAAIEGLIGLCRHLSEDSTPGSFILLCTVRV